VAVLGPNGAGKSTLLKAISRAIDAQGGLTFEGQSLHNVATEKVVGLGICHCPEGRRLFPELSVLKNLQLGAYLRNDKGAIAADLNKVYELFPILQERGSQMVSTLSGGQQQMVAIGRALMGAPKLLLLDEPSVGIAHRLKMEIFTAIHHIRSSGVAILMAEQDAQSALQISDRAYILEQGHVAREGQSADLRNDDHVQKIYLGLA
jgi:branched-chain amino acid transport system ATP-binding protein